MFQSPQQQQQQQQQVIKIVFLLAGDQGQDDAFWDVIDVERRELKRLTVSYGVLVSASEKLAAQVRYSNHAELELFLDTASQLPAAEYMIQHAARQAVVPVSQQRQCFLLELLLLADKHGCVEMVEEVQGVLHQKLGQLGQQLEDGLVDAMCKLCPLPCAAWQLVLDVVHLMLEPHSRSSILEALRSACTSSSSSSSSGGVSMLLKQAALLLAQVFDDLELVWYEPGNIRRTMLCALPLQQAQILLMLGDVRVATEDTVLFTLASNVNVNTAAAAQLQLVCAVRTMLLTPEALMLLPQLGWMSADACLVEMYKRYIGVKYNRGVWFVDEPDGPPAEQRCMSDVTAVTLEFSAPVALVLETVTRAVTNSLDTTLEAAPAEGAAHPVFAGRKWQARFIVYQKHGGHIRFALGLEVQPTFPGGSVMWCPGRSGISVECRDKASPVDGPWVHSGFENIYLLPGVWFEDAAGLAAHLGPPHEQLRVIMRVGAP